MNFIFIDQSAAQEIISDRILQSTSFELGAKLAEGLKTGHFEQLINNRVCSVEKANGIFLLTNESSENRIIFDLVQCSLFNELNHEQALVAFQRGLRFAIKMWDNLRLSVSEHVGSNGKAVYFPFPITSHSSFRIAIDREPIFRKPVTDKRSMNFIVFGSGTQDDLGANITTDTRTATEALNALSSARGTLATRLTTETTTEQHLQVTELAQLDEHGLTSLSLPQWLNNLTRSQLEFVKRQVTGPERIEGPAGTGKTLCLILKCLFSLKQAEANNSEHHIVFFAHSEATRKSIREVLASMDEQNVVDVPRSNATRTLQITTLQEWCAQLLGAQITETELLDRDAMSSKELQLLNLLETYQDMMRTDFPSHERMLSPEFAEFLKTEDEWRIAEMLRHEVGVTIKGRASESFDRYKQLPPIHYNLPLKNYGDLGFVFAIFRRYKHKLEQTNQFDTDDVVLSALGQLDTPLWRRRRQREGFDNIFIDEAHLFNLNELMLFHHLTRRNDYAPIVFAIDRSQAVGDRALTNDLISDAISDKTSIDSRVTTKISTVFRCAPGILNAAQAVMASGATLFTNFENSLADASSVFTAAEEEKSSPPRYIAVPNDKFETEAFERATALAQDLHCSKSDIAIVCFSDDLYKRLSRYAKIRNKPVALLERRGDLELVNKAKGGNLYILTSPEYVGGLEFEGIVLVGVDDNRLPQTTGAATVESRQFIEYAAHNLLYVALTRARFRVEMLGDSACRPTKLLRTAISQHIIDVESN